MQRFLPAVDLQPFIKDFIFINDARTNETPPERFMPDGDFMLVLNLENGYLAQHDNRLYDAQKSAVGYLHTHAHSAFYLHKPSSYRGIALHFTPEGMYHLLRASLFELPLNAIFTFEELMGNWAKDLAERLCECPSQQAQLDYLERQLRQRFNQRIWSSDSIMPILNWIEQKQSKINVQEIAAHFFISRKTLERKFLQRVGLTPKHYLRMIRFRNAYTQLSLSRYHEMMDLVVENGYFDQMHMIKDFKHFVGATPAELAKSANFLASSYHAQYRQLENQQFNVSLIK